MAYEDKTVLNGLSLTPLPEGWRATGVAALVKCLDEKGEETWAFRTSKHLGDEDVLGALVIRTAIAKSELLKVYTLIEDEDND